MRDKQKASANVSAVVAIVASVVLQPKPKKIKNVVEEGPPIPKLWFHRFQQDP